LENINKLFAAKNINGVYCQLHQINLKDAGLIFRLRSSRAEFIETNPRDISQQRDYIKKYLNSFLKKEQIYFKIYDTKLRRFVGVFRLTKLNNKVDFSWESAVFENNCSPNTFLDAMIITYRIGFEYLNRKLCGPWKVKINNKRMMKIHYIMGMTQIVETGQNYFRIQVKSKDYYSKIEKYRKLRFGELGKLSQ
tara:strand:- start:1533 stop:2114 length:582 start_codon:yes stop_codon:yes gene_type:complete